MNAHLDGRHREAIELGRDALARGHHNPRLMALTRANLALAMARVGDVDGALTEHATSVDQARLGGEPSVLFAALLAQAETELWLGHTEVATASFTRALALARRQRYRVQEAVALLGLAHAAPEPERWRAAAELYADLQVPSQATLALDHLDQARVEGCVLCQRQGDVPPSEAH